MDPTSESLLGRLPDWLPAFTHSPAGEIHTANQAFLDLLGYSVDDLVNDRFSTAQLGEFTSHSLACHESDGIESFLVRHLELQHSQGHHVPVIYAARRVSEKTLECVCFDLTPAFAKPHQKTLASSLLDRADDESRAIARKLHDTTAQNLAALAMSLSMLTPLPQDIGRVESAIAECSRLTTDSLSEIRRVSYLLYPPLLDELGLEAALRTYTQAYYRETGISVKVGITTPLERMPLKTETRLLRIVQERLTYLARHTDVTGCEVKFTEQAAGLELRISDDAHPERNMSEEALEDLGLSIAVMRERARQIGSSMSVESQPQGTTIRAIIARS